MNNNDLQSEQSVNKGPSNNGRKKKHKVARKDATIANTQSTGEGSGGSAIGLNASKTATNTTVTFNSNNIINNTKVPLKINKTTEMLQTIPTAVVDNNLDNVLKTVTQLDNTCDYSRCRIKTSLIGQDCRLCKQRFCMKHQLPEVHGCAGAVKRTERNEFLRPRQTLPISAALRRNEQKDAHSRLEQKLKEMSLARQKMRK